LTILKLYTTKENLTVGSVGSVERMEKIQSWSSAVYISFTNKALVSSLPLSTFDFGFN
jgi:hypothetical protein